MHNPSVSHHSLPHVLWNSLDSSPSHKTKLMLCSQTSTSVSLISTRACYELSSSFQHSLSRTGPLSASPGSCQKTFQFAHKDEQASAGLEESSDMRVFRVLEALLKCCAPSQGNAVHDRLCRREWHSNSLNLAKPSSSPAWFPLFPSSWFSPKPANSSTNTLKYIYWLESLSNHLMLTANSQLSLKNFVWAGRDSALGLLPFGIIICRGSRVLLSFLSQSVTKNLSSVLWVAQKPEFIIRKHTVTSSNTAPQLSFHKK